MGKEQWNKRKEKNIWKEIIDKRMKGDRRVREKERNEGMMKYKTKVMIK